VDVFWRRWNQSTLLEIEAKNLNAQMAGVLTDFMARETRAKLVSSSYNAAVSVSNGDLEMAFVREETFPMLSARQKAGLFTLVKTRLYSPHFLLVGTREAGIESVGDLGDDDNLERAKTSLKGKTLAYSAGQPEHNCIPPEVIAYLTSVGMQPVEGGPFFGKVHDVFSNLNYALDSLLKGETDLVLVDERTFVEYYNERREIENVAHFVVLARLPILPDLSIVASREKLGAETLQELRERLVSLATAPVGTGINFPWRMNKGFFLGRPLKAFLTP
jgi:ABC-type phosphate/phosphonate transport system substrate-binding protein